MVILKITSEEIAISNLNTVLSDSQFLILVKVLKRL